MASGCKVVGEQTIRDPCGIIVDNPGVVDRPVRRMRTGHELDLEGRRVDIILIVVVVDDAVSVRIISETRHHAPDEVVWHFADIASVLVDRFWGNGEGCTDVAEQEGQYKSQAQQSPRPEPYGDQCHGQ